MCYSAVSILKKKKKKRGRERAWKNGTISDTVGGIGGWNRKPPEETEKKQKSRRKTRAAVAEGREQL